MDIEAEAQCPVGQSLSEPAASTIADRQGEGAGFRGDGSGRVGRPEEKAVLSPKRSAPSRAETLARLGMYASSGSTGSSEPVNVVGSPDSDLSAISFDESDGEVSDIESDNVVASVSTTVKRLESSSKKGKIGSEIGGIKRLLAAHHQLAFS